MKVTKAKRRATRHRVISAAIIFASALLLFCTVFKSIYVLVGSVDSIKTGSFSHSIQQGITKIYLKTSFLSWVWKVAPLWDFKNIDTFGNWATGFIGGCGLIGSIMWGSASHLAARIAKTVQRVEELNWEREYQSQQGIVTSPIQDTLQISIELDQKDQWYKRPLGIILLTVVAAILAQLANLKFGLVK